MHKDSLCWNSGTWSFVFGHTDVERSWMRGFLFVVLLLFVVVVLLLLPPYAAVPRLHQEVSFNAHFVLRSVLLTIGMQCITRLLCLSHNAGGTWAHFNAEHSRNRRDMLQLYGSEKWLFRRTQVLGAAVQHSLPLLFGIQVKSHGV